LKLHGSRQGYAAGLGPGEHICEQGFVRQIAPVRPAPLADRRAGLVPDREARRNADFLQPAACRADEAVPVDHEQTKLDARRAGIQA
jgi:hypothetical protein